MKKFILMLLYSLSSYADIDIEVTVNGEIHRFNGFKTPYINIGTVTCGITTAKGQIVGPGHEPGESVKIDCPEFVALTKTCRFIENKDSEYAKAWVKGWNSETNDIYTRVDGIMTKIRMLCNAQH